MVLSAIGTSAGEPTVQNAQMTHSVDVELLPSMRRTTFTVTADLKAEQRVDAVSNTVVVRLDYPGSADFVNELDETLAVNRADELVIHRDPPTNKLSHLSNSAIRNALTLSELNAQFTPCDRSPTGPSPLELLREFRHEPMLESRRDWGGSVNYFAKPAVAIVFGAFFLCAETCLHADTVLQFATRPLELPLYDWATGGFLLVAGVLSSRDWTTMRRQYQAVAWAFMLSLLVGASWGHLGEWLTPPVENSWLPEGAFLATVVTMTVIAGCGLVSTLRMPDSR
jgi:hypothetical protein